MKNQETNEIYPTEQSRTALAVFRIYEGTGAWFDLSKNPMERAGFSFGGTAVSNDGYFVSDGCIGGKLCYPKCPQKCIEISAKPAVIKQVNCLYCGNCFEICLVRAIIKEGNI